MKINENQLNWFLKATDSSIDDLIVWLKKWKAFRHTTEIPCCYAAVGKYCGRSIYPTSSRRCVTNLGIWFNRNAKLVNGLKMWDLAHEFSENPAFQKELIQTLEQLKKERV